MTDRDTLRLRFRIANPVPDADTVDTDELDRILVAIESEWDEVRGFATRSTAPDRARRSRFVPAFVFAAAAVLLLLAIGLPMLVVGPSENMPPAEESTTVTTAVTTTVPPTTALPPVETTVTTMTSTIPVVSAPPMTWERVPHNEIFEDATIFEVVNGGPGLVAVGATGDWNSFEEISQGAAFVSSDGYAWEQIDSPAFRSDEYVAIFGAAADPDGTVVAFGWLGNEAAIFLSMDGFVWERIVSDAFAGDGLQQINSVTAGGPGFVAVGRDELDAAVWLSPDGRTWTRTRDDALLATAQDDRSTRMMDVATGGPGLVAVGSYGLSGGTSDVYPGVDGSAVWVSGDGTAWTRMPGFEDSSGESVSIDPEGNRIIAFGSDMWTSTDGDTWLQTEQQEPNIQPYWNARLAWDGDRVVAGVPDAPLSLWVSDDRGSTWSRIDPDDPAFAGSSAVHSVTRLGDTFVAVGIAGAYNREASAVWIGTWDS